MPRFNNNSPTALTHAESSEREYTWCSLVVCETYHRQSTPLASAEHWLFASAAEAEQGCLLFS